jgi:hypothetical protein
MRMVKSSESNSLHASARLNLDKVKEQVADAIVGVKEAAEMKMECFDHVLAYMKKEGLSLDVETYCSLNYSMTWAVVEEDYPEYREQVLDLVSEGELCWVQ